MLQIATSILFAFAFSKRNAFQFKENRLRGKDDVKANEYNTKWHSWQAVIQVLFFVVLSKTYYLQENTLIASALIGVIGAGSFWIVFDGLVNILGLDRDFFYVGKTAAIDRFFQRFSNPELMLGLSKLLFILIPVIIFIYNKKQSKDV